MASTEQQYHLLEELLENSSYRVESGNPGAVKIRSVCADSRTVVPGSLFVAISGDTVDGHDFISDAVERGAVAVLSEQRIEQDFSAAAPDDFVAIRVANTKEMVGRIASRFYGNPAEELTMIGVTGTNGKTTITYLMEHVLAAGGIQVGVIGTVNYRYTDEDGVAR